MKWIRHSRAGKDELPEGNQPPYLPDGPMWRGQSN